uniref:Uncharacterized protein n=1 Tax=Micrurus surinamensis TaxID=129470 RepID=A0A2D4NWQ0_MICSU
MPAIVTPGGKLDSPKSNGALQRHLNGCLLHTIFAIWTWSSRDCAAAEVPFDFGDAVLGRQQPLLDQALQNGPYRRPVHQLQDKKMGTAASRDCDLDGVPARLADLL